MGKRMIKENPFNKETEESYYWLGYFLADGWITTLKNTIVLSSTTDLDHIKKYGNFIGKSVIYKNTSTRNFSIGFGSKEVRDYLTSIGVTTNKSLNLKLSIPINRHILRGFFDGDGCISQGTPKITCSSRDFVDQIVDFLKTMGLNPLSYIKQRNTACYDIRLKGNDRIKFYDLLYADATVFMERKKIKYDYYRRKYKVK